MDTVVINKVDEQQLVELYLNSLLQQESVTTADVVCANAVAITADVDELVVELAPEPVITKQTATIKVLFFKIGKMTIATPMLNLHKVVLLANHQHRFTILPGAPSDSLGILTVDGQNFDVIDIFTLLSTNKPILNNASKQNHQYALLLSETAHAVLCQQTGEFKDVPIAAIKPHKRNYSCSGHLGVLLPDMVPILDLNLLIKARLLKKC